MAGRTMAITTAIASGRMVALSRFSRFSDS
jgi:hypothetical protein